jgi:uncharacterized protein
MKLKLTKKPKGCTLIEGFPGFGFVGNIVLETIIENMNFEVIGIIESPELSATAVIHKGKIINPISLLYNKEKKLILLHSLLNVKQHEWEIAEIVEELIKTLEIKEIISVEGVTGPGDNNLYCFNSTKFEKMGAIPITESIVLGVTGALLLKIKNISCLFAETHAEMPDSRAAAKVIEFFDKYLGLNIDTKKLLIQAEISEAKVKKIMKASEKAEFEAKQKELNYLG